MREREEVNNCANEVTW